MGAETALALGIATLLGGAAWGASEISASGQRKDAKNAAADAANAAKNQNLGNLSGEEASLSASKKMFREGLYFTSPTGTLSGGTRGRSRLMGA